MKPVIEESDVIRIFREENQKRFDALVEELDMYFKASDAVENVVSPELKVKHKKSGLRYTVDSVSARDIVLRSPEGKLFRLNQTDLEDEYEI